MPDLTASLALSVRLRRTASALFDTLFPADEEFPGALEIGVPEYVDRLLTGFGTQLQPLYEQGLQALDRAARASHDRDFADCSAQARAQLVGALERGTLETADSDSQREFLQMAVTHMREGLFADPLYGGNRDKRGWKFLRHPGIWFENSPREMMSNEPEDKGGRYRSIEDLQDYVQDRPDGAPPVPADFDPMRGFAEPAAEPDVVLVGLGAMNGTIVPQLTAAGLRVVALEAGPYRSRQDYRPDELGQSYAGRARMGPKFMQEVPRWRRHAGESTRPCTFSLGRMVNGVGGSVFHYGSWMRRFHPHQFRLRSHIRERGWDHLLPAGNTLADWPVSYAELEPYYTQLEWEIGISGVSDQPPVPRSRDLPMPPQPKYHLGEVYRKATASMGLTAYPVPAAVNSRPYGGRPATRQSAWTCGFGTFDDSMWHPAADSVPRALASGNLDLRTNCRVLSILTDRDGHASGVRYLDAGGRERLQPGRCVIIGAYTWESLRLMFLSKDETHPSGVGNNRGQLGRNLMTKNFGQVYARFPGRHFNRHCANASQSMIMEDYLYPDFPLDRHGFVGGATISAEPQLLPLAISRESRPPDVPEWGKAYKDHLRTWQEWGTLRIQADTLPYACNYADLDPKRRDRSGLGLPLLRITYEMQDNEHRQAAWLEDRCEEILAAMGGESPWRGPRFTGIGSSHDLGGARMGANPDKSVVDPNLEVHDTPGLFVYSGAVYPSCPGINPTLTMMALCRRACDALVNRLKGEGV